MRTEPEGGVRAAREEKGPYSFEEELRSLLRSIDIHSLAGQRRILGLDLTETRAHVVELDKGTKLFDRFQSHFTAVKATTCEFSTGFSLRERGRIIQEALQVAGIKTKKAVTTIRSLGVKETSAIVPPDVDDIGEWISDNSGKILRVPVRGDEIEFRFALLEQSAKGTRVEIAFVRKSELEALTDLMDCAGLQPVSISAGTGDAALACAIGEERETQDGLRLFVCESDRIELHEMREGRRIRHAVLAPSYCLKESEDRTFAASGAKTYVCGDTAGRLEFPGAKLVTPFGLETRYSLAAGLALRGYFPECRAVELLDERAARKEQLELQKGLFQRALLGLGAATLFTLTLLTALSALLEARTGAFETGGIDSAYVAYRALEERVRVLERFSGQGQSLVRSTNQARILHDLAGATPTGVRLSFLSIGEQESRGAAICLAGEVEGSEPIGTYLRTLKGPCREARLEKLGREQKGWRAIGRSGSGSLEFEIRATGK